MNIEQALSQAKLYIRQNQKKQAREILRAIIREYPNDDEAWILAAQVSDDLKQVLYCLRRASMLNPKALETHPNAPQILTMINRLRQHLPPVPSTLPPQTDSKLETDAELNKPLKPAESALPELLDMGASAASGLRKEDPLATKEEKVLQSEMEKTPAPMNLTADPSHPAPSSGGKTGNPATPMLKRKAWLPWVVGLIMLIVLVAVGIIFGGNLVVKLIHQLLLQRLPG
jgi:hypothetical protein